MKIILPIFAIGILASGTLLGQTETAAEGQGRAGQAQVEAAKAVPPVQGADALFKSAVAKMAERTSIAARVRFHVDMLGLRSIGQGAYLQSGLGADRKLRWELKCNIGEQIMMWQQVCDGRYLWQLQETSPKEQSLSRVDLLRVRQALEGGDKADETLDPAPSNFVPALAFGGLPQLMENLQTSFRFSRVEAGQLDQLPVWIVTGDWRADAIKSVSTELADQVKNGQPLDLAKLPPQMPEQVRVYMGQDDLFPYRLEFCRRGEQTGEPQVAEQGRAGEGGGAQAAAGGLHVLLLCELYQVQLGGAIDPREFQYDPAATFADTTEVFLKSLKKQ